MTDKVQKIREFLVGIAEADGVSTILAKAIEKKILPYIDSMQEEPAPKIFEDMLNAKTPAESLGISAEEHDKIIDLCLYGKEPEMVDIDDLPKGEPVSMWHDVSEEPKPNMELICVGQYGNPLALSSNSGSFKSRDISKWAYFNDLLNLSNVQRTGKNRKEPVSENLGEYINELSEQFPEVSFAKLSRIAVRVAKWQRNQDVKNKLPKVISRTDLDEYAYQCAYDMSNDWAIENPTWHDVEDACKLGANWQKEQMMEKGVDAHVNYAWSSICFDGFDWSKTGLDIGDKCKLIIIKED